MQMMRTCLASGVIVLTATIASGYDAEAVAAGARVRVTLSGEKHQLTGDLVALEKESLTITVKGVSRVILRERIEAIAVRRGRRSRARGALLGAAIGVVAGVPAALASGYHPEGSLALWGALIGLSVPPRDKWQSVEIGRVQVGCLPTLRHGPGMSLTIAF